MGASSSPSPVFRAIASIVSRQTAITSISASAAMWSMSHRTQAEKRSVASASAQATDA